LLYGTAWKTDKTARLTQEAVTNGFSGIDTANYPTAYEELLTGDGIAAAIESGTKREDLFIQTKFTPVWAHDKDKIPFNPDQSIEEQIRESIQQSLKHLQVDYFDALLLHIYFQDDNDNLVAWKVFESFVPHTIRSLGVSNFSLKQLKQLYEHAVTKPSYLQNRFYKDTGYDIEVRKFCKDHEITYQAYWMLSHNPEIIDSDLLTSVAERLDVEKQLAFYILILGLGNTQVLNGTTKSERMSQDVKTISELFSDKDALSKLQPEIVKFEELLQQLLEKPSL